MHVPIYKESRNGITFDITPTSLDPTLYYTYIVEYTESLHRHKLTYHLSYNIENISWLSFQTLTLSPQVSTGAK